MSERLKSMVVKTGRAMGLHVQRWHDPFEDAARLLGEGRVRAVVDGGAHKGTVTAKLLERFPQARVHCFEPQAEQVADLERRFGGEARVAIHPVALSDHEGEATLYVNEFEYTTSLLKSARPEQMKPAEARTVGLTTFDAWSEREGGGARADQTGFAGQRGGGAAWGGQAAGAGGGGGADGGEFPGAV